MGTFRVAIEIGDAAGERWETVEALVDTGATYTTVPAELLRRLGVTPHARDTFVLADGRRVEHDIGHSWIRVSGRSVVTLVVFAGRRPRLSSALTRSRASGSPPILSAADSSLSLDC
jgi:aspartyl protease family protein